MAPTPLRERVGTEHIDELDTDQVRSVFQSESSVGRFVESRFSKFSTGEIAAAGAILALMFVIGFVIGGALSTPEPAEAVPAEGGMFISEAQATEYQQLANKLEETENDVAIAQGESAFHQSQIDALAEDSARMRSAMNQARLEMSIIVSIYEACVERLYPLECIENARPEADAFLAELYAEQP